MSIDYNSRMMDRCLSLSLSERVSYASGLAGQGEGGVNCNDFLVLSVCSGMFCTYVCTENGMG